MKPPYRVPLVAETRLQPRNGLKVASTFSGGGGSCYGYELAGYEVVWANEFVASAQETYKANHPDTIVDPRDIRLVQAEDVLNATELDVGELDLFDGSPPCQLFSMAGKREKGWGTVVQHADGAVQKSTADLFFDFARLVRELQPKVFIGENVSGLVRGTAKGYFKLILRTLRECGYRVEAKLLDASWLGVPQTRHRLVFQGVRNDLDHLPIWPEPHSEFITASESVGATLGTLYARDRVDNGTKQIDLDRLPAPTVLAAGIAGVRDHQAGIKIKPNDLTIDAETGTELTLGPTLFLGRAVKGLRKFNLREIRRFSAFPDDYVLTGSYLDRWCRMGNSVPPLMMKAIAEPIRDQILLPIHSSKAFVNG